MSKLIFSQTHQGDATTVTFSGSIDEDASFQDINITASKIILDLEAVGLINSTGILRWLAWMRTLSQKQLVLRKCPRIFIDQLNMVAGFLPNGSKVESFFVPYFNEVNGSEMNVLFAQGKEIVSGQIIPPSSVVDEHGDAMEINIYPDRYFKFAKIYT